VETVQPGTLVPDAQLWRSYFTKRPGTPDVGTQPHCYMDKSLQPLRPTVGMSSSSSRSHGRAMIVYLRTRPSSFATKVRKRGRTTERGQSDYHLLCSLTLVICLHIKRVLAPRSGVRSTKNMIANPRLKILLLLSVAYPRTPSLVCTTHETVQGL
jgi:hypothetical protein